MASTAARTASFGSNPITSLPPRHQRLRHVGFHAPEADHSELHARRASVVLRAAAGHAEVNGVPKAIASVEVALVPLLDDEQRAMVVAQMPVILPDRFRPFRPVIDGVEIFAGTWTEDLPWECRAVLELGFDAKDTGQTMTLAEQLEASASRFGGNERSLSTSLRHQRASV